MDLIWLGTLAAINFMTTGWEYLQLFPDSFPLRVLVWNQLGEAVAVATPAELVSDAINLPLATSALLFVLALLLGLLWLSTRDRTELLWLALILLIRGMFDWGQTSFLSPGAGPQALFRYHRLGEAALIESCFASIAMPIG